MNHMIFRGACSQRHLLTRMMNKVISSLYMYECTDQQHKIAGPKPVTPAHLGLPLAGSSTRLNTTPQLSVAIDPRQGHNFLAFILDATASVPLHVSPNYNRNNPTAQKRRRLLCTRPQIPVMVTAPEAAVGTVLDPPSTMESSTTFPRRRDKTV